MSRSMEWVEREGKERKAKEEKDAEAEPSSRRASDIFSLFISFPFLTYTHAEAQYEASSFVSFTPSFSAGTSATIQGQERYITTHTHLARRVCH